MLIGTLLFAALGATLCFVPLFNLLGYESSLALAVASSLAGAHLGVRTLRRARAERDPAGPEAGSAVARHLAEAHPLRTLLGLWGAAAGRAAALLLAPLALLALNALRVRNCDLRGGLAFFALLPLCSGPLAAALGLVAALLTRRRASAYALAYGALLGASLLGALYRFAASPAVFAYDAFFGYFPGSLYDEEVTVRAPLLLWRAAHGATALAALAAAAVLLDGDRLRLRRRAGPGRGPAFLVVLAALCVALPLRQRLDDRDAVAQALSQERVTRHFVLRYAPGGVVARDIDLYAREHELRYEQLRATLGVTPTWEPPPGPLARLLRLSRRRGPEGPLVVSYLFESARRKAELMGAGETYIAKPWRREIYLQHAGWPHPVLKHELAHLFLGAAGDPLMRGAVRRGVLPEPALLEGAAVAADWPGGRLTVHEEVKALREARLEPPLERLFGLAFWGHGSGRAYTVAGSFCRFLLDRAGPGPLLQIYRAGGAEASFQAAYGRPRAALITEWRRFIDGLTLRVDDREVARERLRRPAVFARICAHELALRRQAAREHLARGEVEAAAGLLRRVCQDDPGEPRHLRDLQETLWSSGRREEAVGVAREVLAHPQRGAVLEAQARDRLGDAAFLRGDDGAARREWALAETLPSDEGLGRNLRAKRAALGQGEAGRRLLQVLVGGGSSERDAALDLLLLVEAERLDPTLALAPYLLGRQLFFRGGFPEAAAALGRALARELPDGRFVHQAEILRAQALLRDRQVEAAAGRFAALLAREPTPGRRLELLDWIDRARRWQAVGAASGGAMY